MPKQRPTDALVRLGRRIRARRLYMQLPLGYFAEQVRLSSNMLGDYEAGRAHPPAFTLLRIAKALGTTTGDLLVERGNPDKSDIAHAIDLFADPLIAHVATTMQRMRPPVRQAVTRMVNTVASLS